MKVVDRVLAGDRLALARLLTKIENNEPEGFSALNALYAHTGNAHLVGVTGAPGTGKSTLVNQLALHLRKSESDIWESAPTVGVVAVDPSSPFTGGAILGDRIRMRDLAGDTGVFIRSMASRGALGGLARATTGVVQALDAAGFDLILIETVGAGQAEVDIARTAHTTIVLSAPGLGDDVQAIKAGILEIADILVVNKADLPSADNTIRALRATLEMARPAQRRPHNWVQDQDMEGEVKETRSWEPPVLATIATKGEGIVELVQAIIEHRNHLQESHEWMDRERSRVRSELDDLLRDRLAERFFTDHPDGRYERAVEQVLARTLSPRQAIQRVIEGKSL
jgi:LAO/AO transport system kinase